MDRQEIIKSIASRLKAARKSAGYKSIKEFCEKNHLKSTTYMQHESGSRIMNAEQILKYSSILELNPGWLIAGMEPIYRSSCSEEQFTLINTNLNREGKQTVFKPTLPEIKTGITTVNIDIFKTILSEILPLLKSNQEISSNDLIDFFILIYNRVVNISGSDENRKELIRLSLDSIKMLANKNYKKESDTRFGT